MPTNVPGSLMPKVTIVKQPLMTKARPTREMTCPISLGCSTHNELGESDLHSANS
jgi:hypothetical protein